MGRAIELPSWGFADTGTRFGKFVQDAAASTVEEKFHDAGLVHELTGSCPTVAVHVLWDFAPGNDPGSVAKLAKKHAAALLCITEKDSRRPSLGPLVSLRAEAVRTERTGDRFRCEVRVLKDKLRGPGWTHSEVCHGPDGLC